MPQWVYTNYSRGYVIEIVPDGDKVCTSFLLLPAENLWSESLRGFLYFLALIYMFVGIAIISDIFMCSIEIITSKKRTVVRWDEERKGRVEREVLVWNETVANLTLMALGSSAPEILLSVVETLQRLDSDDVEDALGTFTIIGSAAFNLLMITAICIVSVPSPDAKKIREFGVFVLTAIWSMWAYIWMLVVLIWITPGVIDIWEAWVTLAYMPLLVFTAYAQDNGWWCKCKKQNTAVGADDQQGSQTNVRIVNGAPRPRTSVFHGPSKELATLEAEKQFASQSNLKSIQEGKTNDIYLHDLEAGNQPGRPKVITPVEERQSFARARNRFRHAAVRSMLGGKKKTVPLPPLAPKTGPPRMAAVVDKVRSLQTDKTEEPPPSEDLCGKFTFASPSYSVMESAGTLDIDVLFHRKKPSKSKLRVSDVQNGNNLELLDEPVEDTITGVVAIDYETRDGSAKQDTEYKYTQGKLVFMETEWKKSLSIPIVNDNQYESDMDFYVILKNPVGDAGLGDPSVSRVTIIDDDEPGEFSFEEPSYHADLFSGTLTLNVVRSKGCDGTVTIQYTTIDGSAKGGEVLQGVDYRCTSGTLCFKHAETSKQIVVEVNKENKKLKNFVITLRNPSLGAKIGEHSACVANIGGDNVQDRLANVLTVEQEEDETWGDQFKNAMTVGGDKDEEGNEILPSKADYILHFITFFWKLLFAFIPPRKLCSGWLTFLVSLFMIGVLTVIVEQLGHLLGCVVGLKTSVTGITIVALGTSLPDTFASRTAAMQDQYADASIGNVNGSNSVNVFLGLGLPWVIAVMYRTVQNRTLRIATANLDLAVTVFTSLGGACYLLLIIRRKVVGGELGGPRTFKWMCGGFLVLLWILYIVICSLRAYDII